MTEIRLPAEKKFAEELSPKACETYILGSDKPVGGVSISLKFVGDRSLVQVMIATLISDRALLLIGEPGTAKSWLSEHLSAAISGGIRWTVMASSFSLAPAGAA